MPSGERSLRTEDLHAPGALLRPALGGAPSRYQQADQFGKSLLRDALGRASVPLPDTEVEVVAATQKIDVYAVPDPARAAERAEMGLLGELSAEPSLFEPFRGTPNIPPIRRVLCKQLTWHHELERRAGATARAAPRTGIEGTQAAPRAGAGAVPLVPFPWLVVISPGRPETILEVYGCKPIRPGVYEAVPGLRMRIVVLAELPRTRETLLLRLLGTDSLLREAIDDLRALPDDAWEMSTVEPLLLHFGLVSPARLDKNEEDDMPNRIEALFEELRQQGRREEAARAVLTTLRVRGIAVPDAARERILTEKDPGLLERWLEKAILAASVAEVLAAPG